MDYAMMIELIVAILMSKLEMMIQYHVMKFGKRWKKTLKLKLC